MATDKRQIQKGLNERDPVMKGPGWSGHTRHSLAHMADQLEAFFADIEQGYWGEDGYLTEKGGEVLQGIINPENFTA